MVSDGTLYYVASTVQM